MLLIVCCLLLQVAVRAQSSRTSRPVSPIAIQPQGTLVYLKDSLGNRVPDFSFAGYKAGSEAIPDVPIVVTVPLINGDATQHIQSAINYVSSLNPDKNGFRGAVLLEKGQYSVGGGLYIRASGVVLRGSGMDVNGTTIVGTGIDRETLVTISGKNDRVIENPVAITDPYVPVNAIRVHAAKNTLRVGDRVLIKRPSALQWIKKLGTDHFGGGITSLGWKPGDHDLYWDREVISVDQQLITLDAPLTTAIDSAYGSGFIIRYNWPGLIRQSAVENMTLVSAHDSSNLKDEQHRWMAITLENIADAWVRRLVFRNWRDGPRCPGRLCSNSNL